MNVPSCRRRGPSCVTRVHSGSTGSFRSAVTCPWHCHRRFRGRLRLCICTIDLLLSFVLFVLYSRSLSFGTLRRQTVHKHTANCIIIAPKRLKLRLSGSARKSQKRFRDTPMFKFQAVLAHCQPCFITQRRETGRPVPIQMQKKVNCYAIRSSCSLCVFESHVGCSAGWAPT
jgi:hypothetical protein